MRRTPRLSRTRLATCTSGDVFACNMNDVREGSASTAPRLRSGASPDRGLESGYGGYPQVAARGLRDLDDQ
jgi:hypothetical protein